MAYALVAAEKPYLADEIGKKQKKPLTFVSKYAIIESTTRKGRVVYTNLIESSRLVEESRQKINEDGPGVA